MTHPIIRGLSIEVPVARPQDATRLRENALPAFPPPAPQAVNTERNVIVSREVLEAAVEQIASFVQPRAALEFSVDETTERQVVRVVDLESGEVLRQFPSEEALAIAQSLDRMHGLLLDHEA